MKSKVLRRGTLGSITAVFLAGTSIAHSESTGIPEADHRIAKMKQLGGSMKAIAAVAKGEAAYTPELNEKAAVINAIAKEMLTLFPEGSGGEKTRSKPEIWMKKAEFEKAAQDFQVAAAGLVKAVSKGEQATIGAALGATGKTCGGCHKPFRTPKDH